MSELQYTTLRHAGDAETEEKKSRFLGHAAPVTTEAEALAVLDAVRTAYPDATHHVYAYVLRENHTVRYSDDREPKGTAGMPVLDVLRKGNVTDAVIVVTRYFGGTLLGTGGLVRAYTAAAKAALDAAEVGTRTSLTRLRLDCSYSDYQKILQTISTIRQENSAFSDRVALVLLLPSGEVSALTKRLSDISGGRVTVQEDGRIFDFV